MTPDLMCEYIVKVGGTLILLAVVVLFVFANFFDP